jgi:hypothetical protein
VASEGLDALALAVGEEPAEVDAGPPGGLGLGEVRGEEGGVVAEAVEGRRVDLGGVGLHTPLDARTRPVASYF